MSRENTFPKAAAGKRFTGIQPVDDAIGAVVVGFGGWSSHVAIPASLSRLFSPGQPTSWGDQGRLKDNAEVCKFSTLDLPTLAGGEMWLLWYNATNLTIEAVPSPEPSTLLLLGCGILGLIGMVRRNR